MYSSQVGMTSILETPIVLFVFKRSLWCLQYLERIHTKTIINEKAPNATYAEIRNDTGVDTI